MKLVTANWLILELAKQNLLLHCGVHMFTNKIASKENKFLLLGGWRVAWFLYLDDPKSLESEWPRTVWELGWARGGRDGIFHAITWGKWSGWSQELFLWRLLSWIPNRYRYRSARSSGHKQREWMNIIIRLPFIVVFLYVATSKVIWHHNHVHA